MEEGRESNVRKKKEMRERERDVGSLPTIQYQTFYYLKIVSGYARPVIKRPDSCCCE